MPTDLDHFGTNTPRERALRPVLAEFEASFPFAGRNGNCTAISSRCWFKDPARGGWLDEPHEAKVYKALQDRLIVVNDAQVTARVRYGSQREERLMREYGVTAPLTAPVNFIVRTLGDVKQGHAQSHVHGHVKGRVQGRVQGRDRVATGSLLLHRRRLRRHRALPKRWRGTGRAPTEDTAGWLVNGAGPVKGAGLVQGAGLFCAVDASCPAKAGVSHDRFG